MMLIMQSDLDSAKVVLEGDSETVFTIAFHPDGMHVFSGTRKGIRRCRIAGGQLEEVGKQTRMNVRAVSVSMDQKWVVCGTEKGASVWDAELQEKVVKVEGAAVWNMYAVDVATDCTRFATGTYSPGKATIWNIATGERLVGPLELGGVVAGVKFSPDGGRIATACHDSHDLDDGAIQVFDAHTGDQLISIENPMSPFNPLTPITWSVDSQCLFATARNSKIKLFDSSTGSQLAEWKIHENDSPDSISITLAANNKFIASSAGRFVSFWDTSTQAQVGIVEDTEKIRSIAFSPDGSRLVTGSDDSGKLVIWDLRGILPESYLPINVSTGFLSLRILLINPCST